MINQVLQYFYPDLDDKDRKKFGTFSLILFLIIGTYWLLRLSKQVIVWDIAFSTALGWSQAQAEDWQPILKMISPIFVLLLVMIYSSFVDRIKYDRLFRWMCIIYTIIFCILTGFFFLAFYPATAEIFYQRLPMQIAGISSFLLIESFGSIIPVMFWAWVNSQITQTGNAKKGYPLIGAGAALGAILGSACLFLTPENGHIWPLIAIGSMAMIIVTIIITFAIKRSEHTVIETEKVKRESVGVWQSCTEHMSSLIAGGRIVCKHPYLLGVFFFSTLFQIVVTVFDYWMNNEAKNIYKGQDFAFFQGACGLCINSMALILSLIGVRMLFKRCKTVITLLVYPVVLAVTTGIMLYYTLNSNNNDPKQLVLLMLTLILIMKGVGYAITNPSKELLWMPTSEEIKLKSKGFIDSIGVRFSKMGGAYTCRIFKNLANGAAMSYVFCLGVVGVWIASALYIGAKNGKLLKDDAIIK